MGKFEMFGVSMFEQGAEICCGEWKYYSDAVSFIERQINKYKAVDDEIPSFSIFCNVYNCDDCMQIASLKIK